jgi:hypothetical protein
VGRNHPADPWLFPVAIGAFFVGYGLQWVGHKAEGNVMGDLVLAKQLAGYVTGRRR